MVRVFREWREGIVLGLYVATALSAWAAVIWLAGGTGARMNASVSFAGLAAGYFLAGLIGGSAYGLLYRLRTRFLGAIAVSMVVWTLLYAVVSLLFVPAADWIPAIPVTALFCGLVAGPISGTMPWYHNRARSR